MTLIQVDMHIIGHNPGYLSFAAANHKNGNNYYLSTEKRRIMALDLVGRWNVAKKKVQKRELNNRESFGLVHAFPAL